MENYREITPESIKMRDGDDGRHYVSARVCTYNVADSFNTSWAPGCFTEALQRKLPKVAWCHDDKRVIGKVISYNDTPDGLDVEIRMSDFADNADAKRMWSHIRDGEYDSWSFWFKDETAIADPNLPGVTRFTSANMLECSPVLAASVPGTKTLAFREEEPVETRTLDETNMKSLVPVVQPGGKVLNKVPHKYKKAPGAPDGALCATCMAKEDHKVHQVRGLSTPQLRDLSVTLATSPNDTPTDDPNALIQAADAALDMALSLASYQDLTALPSWVAQMLALILAADECLDEAMDSLNIDDADETSEDEIRSIDLSAPELIKEPSVPTPADLALLARLGKLSRPFH